MPKDRALSVAGTFVHGVSRLRTAIADIVRES
jgi:hypothetical protein